ncbi:nucleoside recognition domain-containing protein [Paenibacillus aurantiacus]|uniref:Nucleoside recognition domain-containing protein n=1 Tax=Paenibacillus aurantiacus TaxID=1936118 RepID=A0ABV5KXN2_9BACL
MIRTLLLSGLSLLVVAGIIASPGGAFQASLQGLSVWWNIVFPGLLPFLTLLELMLAFGAVHGIGQLLHPLMRRAFKLPGEAGIAVAIGWSGGFPAGAESAGALRKRNAVSRSEGQRLLALAHMPNPLFVLLVVGAGFLHQPGIGAAILLSIWAAGLLVGLAQSLFVREQREHVAPSAGIGALRRAARAMQEARRLDGRTFGKALGDAVTASVAKLMAVGGFMILGSVAVELATPLFQGSLPPSLLPAFIESHIGAYMTSTAPYSDITWNAAAVAAALSFGGVTALLQAGGALGAVDLSLWRLAVNRLFQAGLAYVIALFIAEPSSRLLAPLLTSAQPVLQQGDHLPAAISYRISELPALWSYTPLLFTAFAAALGLLVLLSIGASRRI